MPWSPTKPWKLAARASLAALAVAALTLPGAARAAADPEPVHWQMASVFPSALPQLGTLGVDLARSLDHISSGQFRITFYEPGSLGNPGTLFDAVSRGTVDAVWSTPGYWFAREKALPLFGAVPFGPDAAEFGAWIFYGGGQELMDRIYGRHNIKPLVCGVGAPEAGGWFRREITTVEQLRGLRVRFLGLGTRVLEKLGVITHLLPGHDVAPALERGAIDAAEYSMPIIDEQLPFHRSARFYYFPGWHQQATLFEVLINKDRWNALDKTKRAQIEVACGENYRKGMVEGDAMQIAALKALREKGVKLRRWSPEILAVLKAAWMEVAEELSAEDEGFKETWEALQAFRADYAVWNELGYIN